MASELVFELVGFGVGEDDFVVRFDESDSTRAQLIRFVYSGRFAADVPRIEPMRIASAALGRVMR